MPIPGLVAGPTFPVRWSLLVELMTASQWKRSSSAGFFARRNNKILKQIDWLVEKYHSIDSSKTLERKACLVAIVGQCNVWIESKRHKSGSTRMPAVIALRDQAQSISGRAKERWGKLRKLLVGEKNTTGAPLKKLHAAPAVQATGSQPSDWSNTVNEYWLEAYGDDHIMGRELKEPFQRWLQLPEGEDRSFWDWLKTQPNYAALKADASVIYMDAVSRRGYEIVIRGQQLFAKSGDELVPYDTREFGSALASSQGAGLAIYVVSPDQKLYSGEGVLGLMHHSSFLAGSPVLAAGEIRCENGYIRKITGQSGHYRPGRDFAFNFLLYLRRKGVVLRGIRSEIAGFGVGDAHDHYKGLLSLFKQKVAPATAPKSPVAPPEPMRVAQSKDPSYLIQAAPLNRHPVAPALGKPPAYSATVFQGQNTYSATVGPQANQTPPPNHYSVTSDPGSGHYSATVGPEPDPLTINYSVYMRT